MNMKKSLAVITAILTAAAFAGCSSGSDSSETETEETTTSAVSSDAAESADFDGGDGSESDPYRISTADQLLLVNNDLTAHYQLDADIDLSTLSGKTVIAGYTYDYVNMETGDMDMTKAFSGVFDGNGHTLSNYTYTTDGNQMAVGIFGAVTGTVKNLNVENIEISSETSAMATGGVIGYLMAGEANGINVKNVKASGTNCTGGIIGGSMAAVSNCTAEDSEVVVLGDNEFTDGIVQCDVAECGGLIVGGSFAGSLDNCTAKGTVTAEGNEPVGLGGIAGCIQCSPSITGNKADVVINANNGHAVGGLCGYAGMGDDGDGTVDAPCKITDCDITAEINTNGATHVGGLVGTGLYFYGMEDRFTVENCKVSGSINGAVNPGTVAGRANGSEIISCDVSIKIDGNDSDVQIGKTKQLYASGDQYEVGSKEAAVRLISNLDGTYTPLFDTLYADEYASAWTDACAAIVGDDGAEDAAAMLKYFCAGSVYGEEAVSTYSADPDSAQFYCGFADGAAEITFDNSTVSGVDKDGNELFLHEYEFCGYDETNGFYEFRSADENEDEFAYFCLFPDTPASTFHIEFRYGSDVDELVKYTEGKYAYWMASGILKDCDEDMIKNAIELFSTENLAG